MPPVVRFRPERTDAVVGHRDASGSEQHAILRRLGFGVDGENVAVPTWRARDVTREIDVVEEVARFRLDDVPARLPTRQAMFGRLSKLPAHPTPDRGHARRLRLLGGVHVEPAARGLGTRAPSQLQEPLSSEQAVLRTSLVEGLLASARRNVHAGNEEIALFEQAHVYLPSDDRLPEERWRVGGIAQGGFTVREGHRRRALRSARDRADRSDRRTICLRPAGARAPAKAGSSRCAIPSCQGSGARSSSTSTSSSSACPDLVVYEDVITYPPVRQDLAFGVPEDVTAGGARPRRTGSCRRGAP